MSFVKDLLGGLLVTVVAGAVALAQNAVRKDGIPFVPRTAATVVGKSEVPGSSAPYGGPAYGEPAGRGADEDPGTLEAASGALTAEEIASGRISRDRLRTLLDEGAVVLIDARTAREYEAGHIAGAISVPFENFADHYRKLDETVPFGSAIVCYCQSETCDDSENLARELKFMGYQKVLLYKGGWDEWSLAGYPVVTGGAGE